MSISHPDSRILLGLRVTLQLVEGATLQYPLQQTQMSDLFLTRVFIFIYLAQQSSPPGGYGNGNMSPDSLKKKTFKEKLMDRIADAEVGRSKMPGVLVSQAKPRLDLALPSSAADEHNSACHVWLATCASLKRIPCLRYTCRCTTRQTRKPLLWTRSTCWCPC